jgi:hypothetical protein
MKPCHHSRPDLSLGCKALGVIRELSRTRRFGYSAALGSSPFTTAEVPPCAEPASSTSELVFRTSSRPRLAPRRKRLLIDQAHKALPNGGALIVYESIIDDDRSQNAFGLMMSLNMLVETEQDFDYTASDRMGWMSETGFSATRAEHLVGPDGHRRDVAGVQLRSRTRDTDTGYYF